MKGMEYHDIVDISLEHADLVTTAHLNHRCLPISYNVKAKHSRVSIQGVTAIDAVQMKRQLLKRLRPTMLPQGSFLPKRNGSELLGLPPTISYKHGGRR